MTSPLSPKYSGYGSGFIGHEACPRCQSNGRDRAGDNLARYDDGHAHCFSCGYREDSNQTQLLKAVMEQQDKEAKVIKLPEDLSKTIDAKALNWLADYGILREEIITNKIQWSPSREWLVFPFEGAVGQLEAYQARRFGGDWDKKWYSQGDLSTVFHILGMDKYPDGSPLVLVEDIVSAIKVSRWTWAMPLFGSSINLQRINRIRFLTKDVIIWLDADKYKEALAFAYKCKLAGMNTKVVYTEKDPKQCSDKQIQEAIES